MSHAAAVAEPFDVEAGAEVVALRFGQWFEPGSAHGQFFLCDPLGHQPDMFRRNVRQFEELISIKVKTRF